MGHTVDEVDPDHEKECHEGHKKEAQSSDCALPNFQAILDALPEALVVTDLMERVVVINYAAQRLIEQKYQRGVGRKLAELLPVMCQEAGLATDLQRSLRLVPILSMKREVAGHLLVIRHNVNSGCVTGAGSP